MLLATYHVLLQTWQVNGGQTKYTGHTCLSAHDTGQFINKLPLAPTSLDVLVIRPASASVTTMSQRPEFQVRRARILANLRALQQFYPDYTTIEVDKQVLASLPEMDQYSSNCGQQLSRMHLILGWRMMALALWARRVTRDL